MVNKLGLIVRQFVVPDLNVPITFATVVPCSLIHPQESRDELNDFERDELWMRDWKISDPRLKFLQTNILLQGLFSEIESAGSNIVIDGLELTEWRASSMENSTQMF